MPAASEALRRTPPAAEMAWVPGGSFLMGSEDFYPEERPVHPVHVDGFWMDTRPVTVAAFRQFVKATGYVTLAERPREPDQYADADPSLLVPGSLVFRRTPGPVDLDDYRNWWAYVPGACWRRPGSCLLVGAFSESQAGADWPASGAEDDVFVTNSLPN